MHIYLTFIYLFFFKRGVYRDFHADGNYIKLEQQGKSINTGAFQMLQIAFCGTALYVHSLIFSSSFVLNASLIDFFFSSIKNIGGRYEQKIASLWKCVKLVKR